MREGIRKRVGALQAKVDGRTNRRWGYKEGAGQDGGGKRMRDALAIGEEIRYAAVKKIMMDAKVRGEEGQYAAAARGQRRARSWCGARDAWTGRGARAVVGGTRRGASCNIETDESCAEGKPLGSGSSLAAACLK